jgi:predicted small secreted protein
MKSLVSAFISTMLLTSLAFFITGCNTVNGAFKGAGEDTKAVATSMGIHHEPAHHHHHAVQHKHHHHKKPVAKHSSMMKKEKASSSTTSTKSSSTTVQ